MLYRRTGRRALLVLAVLMAPLLVIGIMSYTHPHHVQKLLDKLKDFAPKQDHFDYLLLKFKGTNSTMSVGDGATIEKENVGFEFVRKKSGLADAIAKKNTKTYQDLLTQPITEPLDYDVNLLRAPPLPHDYPNRANATIIVLARNTEISGIAKTIDKFEQRFNRKFGYPYTFLDDEPFSEKFMARMKGLTDAPCEFVTIPKEYWDPPADLDTGKEAQLMQQMADDNVAYAKKKLYHNMCRFYLGKFYHVPALQKYKWYWRLEPKVQFFNDINYDVFRYLEATDRIYGFTVSLYDIPQLVKLLWSDTLRWLNTGDNYQYVNKNGAFQWLTENQQQPQRFKIAGYLTCHFWSNFEIADMDFYRSEAYDSWFKFLDLTNNFYYERYGDAPVHSMGLGLFADKKRIHWFRDISYFHEPYYNCPKIEGQLLECKAGEHSAMGHLDEQNCMGSWIDFSMESDPYLKG